MKFRTRTSCLPALLMAATLANPGPGRSEEKALPSGPPNTAESIAAPSAAVKENTVAAAPATVAAAASEASPGSVAETSTTPSASVTTKVPADKAAVEQAARRAAATGAWERRAALLLRQGRISRTEYEKAVRQARKAAAQLRSVQQENSGGTSTIKLAATLDLTSSPGSKEAPGTASRLAARPARGVSTNSTTSAARGTSAVNRPKTTPSFNGIKVTAQRQPVRGKVAARTGDGSDRQLLAMLDASLQQHETRLEKLNEKLSEGQRQLNRCTGILQLAMLEAGPEASGLHPFVKVAQRYAGTPYVWGGESRSGFDCSGFIIRVMRDLGYRSLPHSAATQFNYGRPIAEPLLKPGDLVFFANTYKAGISHVGIYLGRRRFIHAAGTGKGTIVSSLDEAYFRRKYAGGRRLIRAQA